MKKGSDGFYRKTFTYDGKRYGFRAKTPELLYKKIAQVKQDLKNGTKVVNENTLVKQWAIEWLDTYKKNSVRQGTYDRYRTSINKILIPAIGNMRIKDVRQVHLQQILNGMKGFSEDYVRKNQSMIFNIFERARKSRMISVNPAEDLDRPRTKEKTTHRALTSEERKCILKLCETHRAGLWVLTLLYCGLRPGETIPLTWNDVDFNRAVLKITKAYDRCSKEFKPPKSKAGVREVPIPKPLLQKLKAACPKNKPFDFVFQQSNNRKHRIPNGKHHTATSLNEMWKDFKTDLNIMMGAKYVLQGVQKKKVITLSVVADDLVPYCLRHTYCTDLEAAGVPINVAARLMGHSSILLTSKIYTHGSEAAFENAAAAINKYCKTNDETGPQDDTSGDTSKPEISLKNSYGS